MAYLRWVGNIDNHDWPPQDSPNRWKRSTERMLAGAYLSPAAALVQQEGCLTCHTLAGSGGNTGPRLEWIGARRDAAYIARYMVDPEKMAHGAQMTPFANLSEAQREMIGEFIVSLAAQGR